MLLYILKYFYFVFILKPITILLYYFVGYFLSPYVHINRKLYLSYGARRNIFIHPNNKNMIIKISKENYIWNNNIENFRSYLFMPNLEYTPKNYGLINTNLGIGVVYSLIRDYDGKISKTAFYYLQKNKYEKDILDQYKKIKTFFNDNYDLVIENCNKYKNIVVQIVADDEIKIIIVDGYDSFLFNKF